MAHLIWRTSLFLYAGYTKSPYFTYWRITIFTEEMPTKSMYEDLELELWERAERDASWAGWELAGRAKLEIEQVQPVESEGLGINVVEYARSDGWKGMPLEERDEVITDIDRFGPPKHHGGLDKFLEDIK